MPETTVIIPNYNGLQHLEACLRSLSKQTYQNFEIVMVDNGSVDGSVDFVKREFPSVKLIPLENNLGFAAAVNKGVSQTGSVYVALLNNDIEVEPTWLEQMVNVLKHHPYVGSVACKMINFYCRDVIDATGDILTRSGSAGPRGHGEKDEGQYDVTEFVFGPCAGAAVYKRVVFDQVGLFDESFFAYYEDVDLDFRMQLQGWKVLYVPSAICYHKRGATMKTMFRFAVKLQVRNRILYMVKNFPAKVILKKLPLIVASRLKNWYEYIRDGYLPEVLQGIAEAMLKLPEMLLKRKKIQGNRKVSIKYIESLMG